MSGVALYRLKRYKAFVLEQRLLSVADLAEYLGIPKATVYRWQSYGAGPPALRVGKYIRFRPAEVEAWLDERVAAR